MANIPLNPAPQRMRLAIDFYDAPYFLRVQVLRLPSELNTQSRRRARECARFYSGRRPNIIPSSRSAPMGVRVETCEHYPSDAT
jgi:hypothetical protein